MYSALCALMTMPEEVSESISRDSLADCIEERVDWLSRGNGVGKPSETERTDWRDRRRGDWDDRADWGDNGADSVTTSIAVGPICLLNVRRRLLLEVREGITLRSSTLEFALPDETTSRPCSDSAGINSNRTLELWIAKSLVMGRSLSCLGTSVSELETALGPSFPGFRPAFVLGSPDIR